MHEEVRMVKEKLERGPVGVCCRGFCGGIVGGSPFIWGRRGVCWGFILQSYLASLGALL